VLGDAVPAVLWHRGERDRRRVDLRVQLDVERQVIRQPPIQGHASALIGAEEVHLPRSVEGGSPDAGHNEQRSEDLDRRLAASARRCGGPSPGGRAHGRRLARVRRRSGGGGRQPGLLGGGGDQSRFFERRSLLGLLEAEGHNCDVVATAGLVRLAHQLRDCRVEVGRLLEDLGNALLADHGRETVGAQQIDVPRARALGHRVDLDLGLRAECAGDDRTLRMVLGLLIGKPALASQLLDQGVVGGQQLQLAIPVQVGPAVADVRERDLVVLEHGRGEGRAHPRDT
jgi:hypothetical protein